MEAPDIVSTDAPALEPPSGGSSAPPPSPSEQIAESGAMDESSAAPDEETESPQPADRNLFRAIEGKRLSEPAKTALAKLKTESPQAYQAVVRALFAEKRLRDELPGGFKDIQQLREQIEELGGHEGIEQTRTELNGFREFDRLYSAGDPKVIDFLIADEEGKQAFLEVAPSVLSRYQELNPEGFSSYLSQVFLADMQQERIPLLLERLQDFLPVDNQQARQIWTVLANYVNRIHQFASQPAARPKKTAAQPDDRTRALDQREANLTRQEWGRSLASVHSDIFSAEWRKQLAGRHITQDQGGTIRELYGMRLKSILAAKPEIARNIERYFSAGQQDGYLRYMENFYRDAAPRALRQAIAQSSIAANGNGQRKPAAQAPPAGSKPGPPAAARNGSDFRMLASKPDRAQIDPVRTTPEMWISGKAILRNGQQVAWRK